MGLGGDDTGKKIYVSWKKIEDPGNKYKFTGNTI